MNTSGFMPQKVLLSRTFFFVAFAAGILPLQMNSGRAQSRMSPTSGEALHYEVTYEWGFIYLEVGEVIFSAQQISDDNLASQWDFRGWGTSKSNWDWFYPVNSTYSSTTNATFLPDTFSRIGREGRHRFDRVYRRSSTKCLELTCTDGELENRTLCNDTLDNEFRDVMSAIHWCRQLPWPSYSSGDEIEMNLMLDGEVHATQLSFHGLTKHLSPLWPDSVVCWEFHPTLIDGTVFKPGDEMKVLMTADDRRLPVYIETELIVGAAKIHLNQYEIHDPVAFAFMRDSCAQIERNLEQ
jgi:hypothetical protein